MRLTDKEIAALRDTYDDWRKGQGTDYYRIETIRALAIEVLESRAAIALNTATHSLISADYTQTIRALEARVAELEGALRQAEDWFRAYGQGHDAKGDTDKAKRNHDRADICARAALGRGKP